MEEERTVSGLNSSKLCFCVRNTEEETQDGLFSLGTNVRVCYLRYLENTLHTNLKSSSRSNSNNTFSEDDIKRCAFQMEKEALQACMVVILYQRAMVKMISEIKRHTQENKLHSSLEDFVPCSNDKSVQTDSWDDVKPVIVQTNTLPPSPVDSVSGEVMTNTFKERHCSRLEEELFVKQERVSPPPPTCREEPIPTLEQSPFIASQSLQSSSLSNQQQPNLHYPPPFGHELPYFYFQQPPPPPPPPPPLPEPPYLGGQLQPSPIPTIEPTLNTPVLTCGSERPMSHKLSSLPQTSESCPISVHVTNVATVQTDTGLSHIGLIQTQLHPNNIEIIPEENWAIVNRRFSQNEAPKSTPDIREYDFSELVTEESVNYVSERCGVWPPPLVKGTKLNIVPGNYDQNENLNNVSKPIKEILKNNNHNLSSEETKIITDVSPVHDVPVKNVNNQSKLTKKFKVSKTNSNLSNLSHKQSLIRVKKLGSRVSVLNKSKQKIKSGNSFLQNKKSTGSSNIRDLDEEHEDSDPPSPTEYFIEITDTAQQLFEGTEIPFSAIIAADSDTTSTDGHDKLKRKAEPDINLSKKQCTNFISNNISPNNRVKKWVSLQDDGSSKDIVWLIERHSQEIALSEILMAMSDQTMKKARVRKRFIELFGSNDGDILCSDKEIIVFKDRISSWIVKYLMPFYRQRRITSRPLFKYLARHIANSIINKDWYPAEDDVQESIEDFFNTHETVSTEDDVWT
uniref:Set2 Rpb1 interacting domain-containing protein n=1 Tax=Timema shepardi TaxID=629360 RepID=A0A7R9AWR6_TIMSH|nr:unnamed protein product [Timema shepardi]